MTTNYYDYLLSIFNNIQETFTLEDLNDDFYNKVVFIYKNHSTGLGGPGCLIMITEDNKEYYIGFEAINKNDNRYDDSGINEYNLEEYIPILKSHLIKEDRHRIKYDIEDNGWVNKNKMLIRQDYFEKIKDIYEEKKEYEYFHPLMIGDVLVDRMNKPQRIYYLAYKKYIEDEIKQEKEYIADLIEENDLEWKKYYIGNTCLDNDLNTENGYYCLLFNEEVSPEANITSIIGHRWIIKYQFKDYQKSSLDFKTGKTERINKPEAYNLYYKRYLIVAGKMQYPDPKNKKEDINELDYLVFNNKDLGYGEEGVFIKSYKTLKKAKQAVVYWNITAGYGGVLKSNRVLDYSSKFIELQQKLEYLEPYYLLDEKYDAIIDVLKQNKIEGSIIRLRDTVMTKFDISYYNAGRLLELFSSYLTNKELSRYSNEYRRIKKELTDNYKDIYLGDVDDIF